MFPGWSVARWAPEAVPLGLIHVVAARRQFRTSRANIGATGGRTGSSIFCAYPAVLVCRSGDEIDMRRRNDRSLARYFPSRPTHLPWCSISTQTHPASFREVAAVALRLRELLHDLGLSGWPNTSAITGVHKLLPGGQRHTYEDTKAFALVLDPRLLMGTRGHP